MERLTGNRITLKNGIELCDLMTLDGKTCEEYCNGREDCEGCVIQNAFNRLSAYEDTGLEPGEIAAGEDKVKQTLQERFRLETNGSILRAGSAFTRAAITEIYSSIFGISYDDAAKELHDQPEN